MPIWVLHGTAGPAPPAALSITIPSGLVAYFPLDTVAQTTDIIGAHNGTLAGSNVPTGVAGQIAQGLQFNSDGSTTTSYMTFGSFQGPQTGFSFSCWTFQTSFPNFGVLLAMGDNSANAYAQIFYGTNGSLDCRLLQDDNNFIGRTTAAAALPTSAWNHVVMTWSGGTTNASIKIYINNAQVDAFDDPLGTFTAPDSGSQLWSLGNQKTFPAANNFVGSMDDVRIYNRALTAGEVTSIFNAGTAGNP